MTHPSQPLPAPGREELIAKVRETDAAISGTDIAYIRQSAGGVDLAKRVVNLKAASQNLAAFEAGQSSRPAGEGEDGLLFPAHPDVKETLGRVREALQNAVALWRPFATDSTQRLWLAETEAALASLSTLPEASGWRTIETAPRDGTTIIAGGFKYGPPVQTVWWGTGRYDRSRKAYNQTWMNHHGHEVLPTHWQPLPLPPGEPS